MDNALPKRHVRTPDARPVAAHPSAPETAARHHVRAPPATRSEQPPAPRPSDPGVPPERPRRPPPARHPSRHPERPSVSAPRTAS